MKSGKDIISLREMELAIFDILASGCATYPEVKDFLTDTFRDRIETDNVDQKRKSRLSDESLFKLLSNLRRNDLIQSARYFDRKKQRNFTLYANTENSIEVLLRETAYQRNHIRSPYLPGRYAFWHDKDLTRVVRKIKWDSTKHSYFYGFEDEFALRCSAEKAKKGDLYPDLKLHIKNEGGDDFLFQIEVQRHRDRVHEFAQKLLKSRNNLVLFKDKRLISDIADTGIYVRDNAIFALIDDFIENGLLETKWLSTKCEIVGLQYTKV